MKVKTQTKTETKPGAWIVNSKDRGRYSIKNGKCFLQNDASFEIELFNPLTVSVLADIKLNGQSISKTGLVIKPGQRVYLDCFIDDRKKFKFSTYEIENSEESLDATKNNGLLEVFFYKEDVISIKDWKKRFDRVIVEKWYPVYFPTYYPAYQPYTVWYSSPVYGGILNNTGGVSGTITTPSGSGIIGTSTTTNAHYSSTNTSYTSQVDLPNLIAGGSLSNNSIPINSSIETGRVEKESSSSQKFTEVDIDFENHYIASTIIQILPESRKPAEIKQVKGGLNSVKAKDILKRESEDVIELIKKLADLHSAGILTDEEFSTKKAELLSKI
jgi:hypothetical protein